MSKTTLATLTLLIIATTSLFAQVEGGQRYSFDELEEMLNQENIGYHVDRVAVENVELTVVDKVAGNLRMIFNPKRAFDHWPEYRYDYSAVADICRAGQVHPEMWGYELGTTVINTSNAGAAIFLTDPEVELCNLPPISESDASSETSPITAFFITSRPIPDRRLEFERVNLEFTSSSS